MFERFYRQRLEEDLTRWQAEGLIPSASVQAIRGNLPPISRGITVATMIGIVGGLVIAAGFLAFVAANWTEIARPARFAILIAGIAGAYGLGPWFDRTEREYLADLAVGAGSVVFGAAIALRAGRRFVSARCAAKLRRPCCLTAWGRRFPVFLSL